MIPISRADPTPHLPPTIRRVATACVATVIVPSVLGAQGPSGLELARELGCGACHSGMPEPGLVRAKAPRFGPDATPIPAQFVFEYLADPRPRRPEVAPARMPDFRLSEDERLALALFLGAEGTQGLPAVRERHPEITAQDGRLLFTGLGCAGCHGHAQVGPVAPDRVGPHLDTGGGGYRDLWLGTFLRDPVQVRPGGFVPGTGSRMPDFRLTDGEADALLDLIQGAGARSAESPPPLTAWGRSRAESYLGGRLACLGCHQWRDEGGVIAPPLDGVSQRLRPPAVSSAIHDPGGSRPGSTMPPSLFRPGILDEVASLLGSEDRRWQAPEPVVIPWPERRAILEAVVEAGTTPTGRDLYRLRCAQCHGAEGNGAGFNGDRLPTAPTAHADSALMSARPDDTLHDGIAAGGWVLDKSHRMPAFRESLTRDQIRSLVSYIRELCRCAAPGWSRAEAVR